MDQRLAEHKSVRFKREEIDPLDSYPSCVGAARSALHRFNVVRWCARAALGALVLGFLVVAGGVAAQLVGTGAIGQERLRAEAQRALTALAGFDVGTQMGDLRLVLGERSLVALEIRYLDLTRSETGASLLEAERVRLGFKLLPLLGGRIALGDAGVSGARLYLDNLPGRPESAAALWRVPPAPHVLRDRFFAFVRQAYDLTDRIGTRQVSARDVAVVVGAGERARSELVVARLNASRSPAGKMDFDGTARLGGRDIAFTGEALRPGGEGPLRSVGLRLLRSAGGPFGALPSGDAVSGAQPPGSDFALSIEGSETRVGQGRLAMEMTFDEAALDLGRDGRLVSSGRVAAEITDAQDAIAVRRAQLAVGRSQFDFTGVLRPAGEAAPGGYAFRFLSQRSTVAPMDSPEPSLPFAAEIDGRVETGAGRIVAETIRILTERGAISASAGLTLERGKTPGLSLAVYTGGMPTGEVKQFWPWFAASGAREWVLDNLFGGRVVEGNLRLRVPPGRLGDGRPLGDDEVSGAFAVEGARFDVAGGIPPVRDGVGRIDFQGSDIDIAIDSGAVFMASGRKVETSNGSLAIRDAHERPRIGKLAIDVAGAAPAIVELASFEPIDASRMIDLAPGEVEGEVTGRVEADVPLSDGIARETLGWRVELAYEGLSIARPFDGQMISDASGSLVVEPRQADISASAKLNGIPADLELSEPLGGGGAQRSRRITLKLDDAVRERILPGLGAILSGPTALVYEERADGRKTISVDLEGARLALPWLNWRKEPGVPARASFILDAGEERTVLSDFDVAGETFSAHGEIVVADGALVSARFDEARLRRGDRFSATIARSGGRTDISVQGEALDARALIERYVGGPARASAASGRTDAAAVTLDARLASVSGFHGETLHDARLSYTGDGGDFGHFEANATTRGGGGVAIARDSGGLSASFADAGAAVRFLDFYEHMEGGRMQVALEPAGEGRLTGRVTAENFFIVDEPRLRSLVAAAETDANGAEVDANRVRFENGAARVTKGPGSLVLEDGVLRGPLIGSTFQGTLFDADDNIAITGTFMPLYGFNRMFGEIPILGQILGNGRDRGLIGITYRLFGKFERPELEVNPISAIAPGIFRQIFEFR